MNENVMKWTGFVPPDQDEDIIDLYDEYCEEDELIVYDDTNEWYNEIDCE